MYTDGHFEIYEFEIPPSGVFTQHQTRQQIEPFRGLSRIPKMYQTVKLYKRQMLTTHIKTTNRTFNQ